MLVGPSVLDRDVLSLNEPALPRLRRKAATRIIKAEVVQHPGRAPKNNPRFVVTNLRDAPEAVYQLSSDRWGHNTGTSWLTPR